MKLLLMGCLVILLSGMVIGCAQHQSQLKTVSSVELPRYLGKWYEIARLPNRFQNHCIGEVTASYKQLEGGDIQVINRCRDQQGEMDEAKGVARIVDDSTNAKLEVSFVSLLGWSLFWGDYWILGLGSDYDYAVVGMPSRKYLWVLSRQPEITTEKWSVIEKIVQAAGYDPGRLIRTDQ
ncbi:MAG: lipocalin family protein [Candidatus Thiodiazotropha taylori]|nr:lipocalin family protein [Candidatus Thiodiazotropha taylori]MCG7916129.1 lipocalin family protein [Candidatus Thiodiazotropha taylori]MCG7924060.1 lipocalin family protein [Candidatus Thiodiazotropha taylori]MCG7969232.1 lipocalin family protein [Candidatus Thiodiazotropha taylori]MCG8067822.1 lipocalin family protein [Candidatus Thiodiazotropha taylori]